MCLNSIVVHFSLLCSPEGSTDRFPSCTLLAPNLSVRSLSNLKRRIKWLPRKVKICTAAGKLRMIFAHDIKIVLLVAQVIRQIWLNCYSSMFYYLRHGNSGLLWNKIELESAL